MIDIHNDKESMEAGGWFDGESTKRIVGEERRNGEERERQRERMGSSGRGLAGSSGTMHNTSVPRGSPRWIGFKFGLNSRAI